MPKRRKAHKRPARAVKPLAPAEWERDSLIAHLTRQASPEQSALLRMHATAVVAPCLLCDCWPAEQPALFIVDPAHSALWGGTRGKWRVVCYHVCTRCFRLPDCALRAEAQIARAFIGSRN